MTLYFDKLIDRYIPTDSGWNFHPDNTATLTAVMEEGVIDKLVIDQANPLPHEYKQLMYSNISGSGNASVYYLDMITSKDSGELPTIERDLDASNAKAIKLAPNTTMIFKTNYPYNKDRLKKVLCRCRKATGATTTLHVGVVGIEDKAYKQPDGTYGNKTFYEVTVSGEITESYVTYVGYILGTDSVENIALGGRPNRDPDYPAKLLDGTTDIALVIKTGSGTGDIFVDSIELQDTENALAELPRGKFVVDSLEGLTDDNKLSPVEKTYIKTMITEIDAGYAGALADGVAAGVSSAVLTTKWNALHAIVTPVLEDMGTVSDITSAFDTAFDEYYTAVSALEEQVAIHTAGLIGSLDERSGWEVQISGGPTVQLDSTPITLSVILLKDGADVTNDYEASDFDWCRVSSNTSADLAWKGGVFPTGKTLTITKADLESGRAIFLCKFKYLYGGSSYYFKTGAVAISEEVPGPQGIQGDPSIVGLLTNDSHVVPTDSAGNNGNFYGCSTTVKIVVGTSDDSNNWSVTATPTNVEGTLSGKTYTVESLSADIGYVDFSATRSGYATIPLRFTVTRSKQGSAGAPATAYWLVSSVAAVKKTQASVYVPATVTFSSKSQTGDGSPAYYDGRFVISESTDGLAWTMKYTSASDEHTKIYTPSAGIGLIKCQLYQASGTVAMLDEETVPIVLDGTDGLDGLDGVDGNDGTSIIWKGDFSSHPSSPENGWAYRNTTDKKSYVYYGTWYQMTIDGADGENGISITWKGESADPPASPQTNWAYRDTDNGLVYIYNGTAWELMVQDGVDGNDGAGVDVEYSANATDWHASYTAGDTYLRQRIGDGVWSSAIKFVGDSAYGITLHPSALTIPVSSRGVPYSSNITISAIFQNIPTTYEITWGITGASFVDAGTNQTKVVEVDTITGESIIVTASVLFGGTTYNAPFVTLVKIYDGKPAPVYIGKSHSIPHDVGGEPIIAGDFFIVDEQFIDGSTTYKVGEVWEYSGTAWVLSDSAMKAIDAMADFVNIKLQDPSAVDEGIFCEVVAKKIMAQEAVITEIGTKEITLKTGGKIKSEIQIPGVTGFEIRADGSVDLINASMVSGLFTGTIDSPPLTTTEESDAEDPVTFDSFTHWSSADVYNELVASLAAGTWHIITGTYNTVPIIKAFMTASTAKPIEFDLSGSSSASGYVYRNATIVYAGTYELTIKGRLVSLPPGSTTESYAVFVNGVKVSWWSAETRALNAGDVVQVRLNGGDWTVNPNYTILLKEIIPAGLTLRSATLQYHFPVPNFYPSAVYDLVISSPSINTGSATFKKYAKATAFLAGVSAYAVNMFKSAQGTVSINGVNRTLSGVSKTSTGMKLFHDAGSASLIAAATDPGASGYYNISGSYEITETVEGAATMNLNAKTVDTYSIGTTVRYLNMAAKAMIAETFNNSSARDKKKDIAPFSGSALDILKQVQVVNYRYKTETGEYLHTGFIAEDTPDPLTGADHNSMSLSDNVGMLIKAVQELCQLILGGSNA